MVRVHLCLLLFFCSVESIWPQSFSVGKDGLKFNIIDYAHDSIPPTLEIQYPVLTEGFDRFYFRDSQITIAGRVEDLQTRVAKIMINDRRPDTLEGGRFRVTLPLAHGENKILVVAADRNNNICSDSMIICQDPDADLKEPAIEIIEPRAMRALDIRRPKDTLWLKARVLDESGIYGVWYNGDKIDSLVNGEFTRIINYEGDTSDRVDTINIVAIDQFGNKASLMRTIRKSDAEPADTLAYGEYYALVIAVEDYDESMLDLKQPKKDAQKIIKTLETNYIFKRNNIVFLPDPTRRDIIRELVKFKNKIQKDKDNLLIFYAGHGKLNDDVGYWWLRDAKPNDLSTWYSNSELCDQLRSIPTKHTLLITDACFSAALLTRGGDDATADIKEKLKNHSRRAITSGSLEVVPDESVFIEVLVNLLDGNVDQYLSASDLFNDLKKNVIRNRITNQNPQYGGIQRAGLDEFNGDFVFIRKAK